jgi:HD superfamily phosphodiesterase
MSVSSWKDLGQSPIRDNLLLAEMAALLHDVGKFCNLHIESHAKGGQIKWSNRYAYKAVLDNPEICHISGIGPN